MITKNSIKDINLRIVDIIIVTILFFVVIISFAFISGYIFYPGFKNFPSTPELLLKDLLERPSTFLLIFTCIIVLLFFSYSLLTPICWISLVRHVKLSAIGLKKESWIQNFIIGMVFGLIYYISWGVIGFILRTMITIPVVTDFSRLLPYSYWASFIVTIIIAPTSESIWYIGLIFHAFAKKIGLNLASVITALIFMLMHVFRVTESNYGAIILLGFFINMYIQILIYRKRGSLLAPIGFHMAYNIISFFSQLSHAWH